MARKRVPRWVRRLFRLLRPRSGGVPVPRAVMGDIWAANAARERGDWGAAADRYAAVLAKAPHLSHLWVQHGHMLRELGRRPEAADAYRRAVALAPRTREAREAHSLLVMLARAAGDRAALLAHALAAFRVDPTDAAGQATLLLALSAGEPGHAEPLREVADRLGLVVPSTAAPAPPPAALYIDLGDLVAHLAGARLPSGLQRVEIEVVRAVIARGDPAVALCCWSIAAAGWKPLSGDAFLALVDAAAGPLDAAGWRRHVNATLFALATAPTLAFPAGSTLFTLGMAWGDACYHPAVARAKAGGGLRFAAIACDVIPLVRADEVPGDIVVACGGWLDALADHADAIVAISRATRDDIVWVSAARGRPIPAARIGVAPLDATFAATGAGDAGILARHGLVPGGYALYVSTVEPRKNHLAAFRAWQRLIADPGVAAPDLVCVGRMGWRSEAAAAMLAGDRSLAARVHMLQGIADDELERLYRACAFLFYPSLQEGWGLPVTEALARGKVPVIGRNSSLPEAGGDFAVYVDTASPADMAATIARLVREPSALAAREDAIRDGFRPRGWAAVADAMLAVATGAGRREAL